jgi:ribosomal-protein-alanine N-acetyltransferase
MVARPPLRIRIEPMGLEDVADVHRIEASSFPTPWPDYAFRQEIQTNRLAHYLVVRAGGETIGYGGMWRMYDEAHVTTFAVSSRVE